MSRKSTTRPALSNTARSYARMHHLGAGRVEKWQLLTDAQLLLPGLSLEQVAAKLLEIAAEDEARQEREQAARAAAAQVLAKSESLIVSLVEQARNLTDLPLCELNLELQGCLSQAYPKIPAVDRRTITDAAISRLAALRAE